MTKATPRNLTILFLVCISSTFFAQFEMGETAGYANAGLTINNVWSMQHNQAGLSQVKNMEVGIAYKMSFLLSETSTQSIVLALPVENGAFGITLNSYGYQLFNKGKYGIAYGRILSEKISAGIQMNYETIRLGDNYGKASVLTFEGGFQYYMSEKIILSGHLFNPNRSKYNSIEGLKTSSKLKTGFRYTFSEQVFIVGEVWKDNADKAHVIVGTEFNAMESLVFRLGLSTNPSQVSLGVGFKHKSFQFDLATDYHSELGLTPNFSLRYAH